MSSQTSHALFLRWLIFVGVLSVGALVVLTQGFFFELYKYDKSYLSLLIVALLCATTLHAGYLIKRLSKQLEQTGTLRDLLLTHPEDPLTFEGDQANIGKDSVQIDKALAHQLNMITSVTRQQQDQNPSKSLLDALAIKLRSPQRSGWMLADLLIKLGLLGTVIGFIYMLYSMESFDAVDISTVQNVLIDMSSGMRVALFTTLSGLIGGIIAGIQYQMADRGADDLLVAITEVLALDNVRNGNKSV